MKKYRKLACILAGSMTMSLFAGCIGNGDVVPEEKNESTDTEEPTASETSQEIKKAESHQILLKLGILHPNTYCSAN